ncbi:MAG: YfiR family protein [Deltaproteobacteria bacterium]|nr:YfiR family protein [Deltaproteobacteria bacterium]
MTREFRELLLAWSARVGSGAWFEAVMAVRETGGGRLGELPLRRDVSRWQRAPRAVAACLLAILCVVSVAAPAGSGSLDENQLKAAYLYNFARYVEWPDSAHATPSSALEIGVVGDGPVSELLKKTVVGKRVGERSLRVVDLKSSSEGRKSHILFVAGKHSGAELERTIANLKGTHVFVVAETEGFAKRGGIANFIVADSRVRFAINKNAADKAGLKVSSKLLRLAELVD